MTSFFDFFDYECFFKKEISLNLRKKNYEKYFSKQQKKFFQFHSSMILKGDKKFFHALNKKFRGKISLIIRLKLEKI